MSGKESDMAHVDYMLNVIHPGLDLGVPDPWYHDMKAFEKVFLQLDEACDRIVEKIIADSTHA